MRLHFVKAKTLQNASMTFLAVMLPVTFAGMNFFASSAAWGIVLLNALYVSASIAVGGTLLRYVREDRISLPTWRRIPYLVALALLIFFCLCPLAAWPTVLSGADVGLHLRPIILAAFGTQILAAMLVWFGRGWQRVGLTVASYWLLLLWMFPLNLRE